MLLVAAAHPRQAANRGVTTASVNSNQHIICYTVHHGALVSGIEGNNSITMALAASVAGRHFPRHYASAVPRDTP
jgi:hypothetical protein